MQRNATKAIGGLLAAGVLLAGALAIAGSYTGTKQSSLLYTDPVPGATGGIHGTLLAPAKRISEVFVMDADNYKFVYVGEVLAGGKEFRISGLPAGRYEVILLFPDAFYEGFTLHRGTNTLTTADRQAIEKTIQSSVPFFDTKKIHRLEGSTGRAGKARCVLQDLRTRPTTLQDGAVRGDIQIRSLKLALLEDVNIGWSLENTREIKRQEVGGTDFRGILPHHYSPKLGNIRVTDTVKDLGELSL